MKNVNKTQSNTKTRSPDKGEIKFRTKFENMIPEGLCEKFIESARVTNSKDPESAVALLWQLTYNPESGINTFGFTTIDPTSPVENVMVDDGETKAPKPLTLIPENIVRPFRNELRYQYELSNKGFHLLEIDVSESCKEAYKALFVATGSDAITSMICYDACLKLCKSSDEQSVERCIALLGNQKDQNLFGGIRSLHFGYHEANYLKPYAAQLHVLLSALWEEEKSLKKAFSNHPMGALGQMLEEEGVVLPETTVPEPAKASEPAKAPAPAQQVAKESGKAKEIPAPAIGLSKGGKPVTASAIMANKEIFENFLDAKEKFKLAVNAIEKVGFDRREVVEKAEAISKILEAFQLLG